MSQHIQSITYLNGQFCGVSLDTSAEPYRISMAKVEGVLQTARVRQAYFEVGRELSLNGKEHVELVCGYDSSHALAYTVEIPPADKKDLDAIVDMQVEALLPLSAQEMVYDWKEHSGKAVVVATKAEPVRQYVEMVQGQNPVAIHLNLEGVVTGWNALAQAPSQHAILAWWHDDVIEIIQLEAGEIIAFRVIHADIEELTELGEEKQLVHDLNLIAHELGMQDSSIVFIPSNSAYAAKMKALQELGARLKLAELNLEQIDTNMSVKDVLFALPSIGLALNRKQQQAHFNLFQDVYKHSGTDESVSRFPKIWISACVASIMFVFYLYASYVSDVRKLEKMSMEPETNQTFTELMQQQALHQEIVSQRPDLLDLLAVLSPEKQSNLSLKSVDFRKGQTVKLTGVAKKEQHYTYLKALQQSSELSDVQLNNPVYNQRSKETAFSMTFNYKQWGKKKSLYPLIKK